jgi:hypothetical protein
MKLFFLSCYSNDLIITHIAYARISAHDNVGFIGQDITKKFSHDEWIWSAQFYPRGRSWRKEICKVSLDTKTRSPWTGVGRGTEDLYVSPFY